jgi:hypothetical protein
MRTTRHVVLVFALLAAIASAGVAATNHYDGDCFYCEPTDLVTISERCEVVWNETWGQGTSCSERTIPPTGWACWTNGLSCYRITVDGGTGGGGTSGCSVENGTVCPAACIRCERPRI